MVRLRNIKKNSSYIQADYYPENTQDKGFLKVNLENEEIVESQASESDGQLRGYMHHAAKHLCEIADNNNIPPESWTMWY